MLKLHAEQPLTLFETPTGSVYYCEILGWQVICYTAADNSRSQLFHSSALEEARKRLFQHNTRAGNSGGRALLVSPTRAGASSSCRLIVTSAETHPS